MFTYRHHSSLTELFERCCCVDEVFSHLVHQSLLDLGLQGSQLVGQIPGDGFSLWGATLRGMNKILVSSTQTDEADYMMYMYVCDNLFVLAMKLFLNFNIHFTFNS